MSIGYWNVKVAFLHNLTVKFSKTHNHVSCFLCLGIIWNILILVYFHERCHSNCQGKTNDFYGIMSTRALLRKTIKQLIILVIIKIIKYISVEIHLPTAYPFPRPPVHPTFTLLIKPTIITIVLKKWIMIVSSSLKRSQT